MKIKSSGLRRAGAGRQRRACCELGAGKAAVPLVSALGGGREEAAAAVGTAADVAGADAAGASW
eukprot:5766381-Pleurochrysis_carterae.AAC.4